MLLQDDGYSKRTTWANYNGTIEVLREDSLTDRKLNLVIKTQLISYSACHRYRVFYERPRMYLFTYAYNDKNANELFSGPSDLLASCSSAVKSFFIVEYHLGRKAFRICKRNTRYCAWHYEMPDLYIWRSACVTYDGYKDLYKLYIDGVKVESGPFSGDEAVAVVRPGGLIYLGQDQDNMGGGFHPRQSWSGEITQFNIWDFALEEWMVENAAECRSDIIGNVIKWRTENWITNDVISVCTVTIILRGSLQIKVETRPLFQLCGEVSGDNQKYFLFPKVFNYW